MKAKSRKEALASSSKLYNTGKLCIKGHQSDRLARNGGCVACEDQYYTQNKDKIRDRARIYRENNQEQLAAGKRKWASNNRDRCNQATRKHDLKEGHSVYRATFPSGSYIGSGQTTGRRLKHTSGGSRIARKLGEKATNFEILIIGSKDYCTEMEFKLINHIGIDKLLNKKAK